MTPQERATEFVNRYPNLFTEDAEWWAQTIGAEMSAALSTAEQRIEELEKDVEKGETILRSQHGVFVRTAAALSKAESMIAELRAEREKELENGFEMGWDAGVKWHMSGGRGFVDSATARAKAVDSLKQGDRT